MDTTMEAGIIGAVATMVAALVPFTIEGFKQLRVQRRRYRKRSKTTANDLRGSWIGYTQVLDDIKTRQYRASLEFNIGKRLLSGIMTITVEDGKFNADHIDGWKLEFTGGFIRDGYIQLDYWNPNTVIPQFGSIIYSMKDQRTLDGKFVALGRDLGRMIYGTAMLHKK